VKPVDVPATVETIQMNVVDMLNMAPDTIGMADVTGKADTTSTANKIGTAITFAIRSPTKTV
jgi:hypothetical protein